MLKSAAVTKKQRRKAGQIVKIDLGNGKSCLAIVLTEPLIAFFGRKFGPDELINPNVGNLPVAFTLMVMNHAVTSGRWPVLDRVEIPSILNSPPKFCKQDSISGKLFIYHEVPELAPNYERAAKPEECFGLETAAVWDPEHVEDRLRDYFSGVQNKWVEQLKIAPQ